MQKVVMLKHKYGQQWEFMLTFQIFVLATLLNPLTLRMYSDYYWPVIVIIIIFSFLSSCLIFCSFSHLCAGVGDEEGVLWYDQGNILNVVADSSLHYHSNITYSLPAFPLQWTNLPSETYSIVVQELFFNRVAPGAQIIYLVKLDTHASVQWKQEQAWPDHQ